MNLNIFQRRSLKTRITLFTLAIFVASIWSLTLYASRILHRDMERQLGEQQFSSVALLAGHVNQDLDDRLRALEKVAGGITPAIMGNRAALQKFLEDRMLLQNMFNGIIFVTGADGTATASTPFTTGRVGFNFMHRDHIATALKEGKTTVGKPHISKTTGFPEFGMAAPIRDGQGKVIGALAGLTYLSRPDFMGNISENSYGKTGGYMIVAPQHKLIVTATDKSRIMQPVPAPGLNRLFDEYMQGFQGFGITLNSLGVEELTAAKQIPVAGWLLVASIPAEEAFAPIKAMQRRIFIATIFMTILAGVLTRWMLKRQLSPMLSTMETLSAVSDSEHPPQPLPITRHDEIGQLIGGFNCLLKILGDREKALRYATERLMLATRAGGVGIWELDIANNSLIWDDLMFSLYGISPDMFGGDYEAWRAVVHPEDLPQAEEEFQMALRGEREFDTGFRVIRPDGIISHIRAQALVHRDDSGQPAKVTGINYDITPLKRAAQEKLVLEQQFQQSQKLESLGVLAGGIAHDFNNILAVIICNCSLAIKRPEIAAELISEIEQAGQRGAELCRQMLAYAGKAHTVPTRVKMTSLVDDMLKMLKATLNQNVAIIADLSADIPTINVDASQVRQIIMNLIINASEAIGEAQGEIRVSLAKREICAGEAEKDHLGKTIPTGSYICLEVADNGCGMDDETRKRIFEPFYTTKFTGRGLGMSAVLGIITSHKGAFQLSSQKGHGAIFKIYLPVHDSEPAMDQTLQQVVPAPWQGDGTILLVEDEPQLMMIAKALLEALGFTVFEAANGREALDLYNKNAEYIKLVITDMGMPVMDGYEFICELKKINPGLPVIVSSGFGDLTVSSRIAAGDVAGFLSKPYSFDQLRTVLKNVVEGAQPGDCSLSPT